MEASGERLGGRFGRLAFLLCLLKSGCPRLKRLFLRAEDVEEGSQLGIGLLDLTLLLADTEVGGIDIDT